MNYRVFPQADVAVVDVRRAIAPVFEPGDSRDCVAVATVYLRYVGWFAANEHRAGHPRLKPRQFGICLRVVFPSVRRRKLDRPTVGGQKYWYRGLRWKDPDSRTYVSDHMHKLNESTAAEIRRLRMEGQTVRAIADRFGVCASTVNRIIRGQRWKRVNVA